MLFRSAGWQRRTAVHLDFRPQKANLQRPTTIPEKLLVNGLLVGLFVFLMGPLLALVWRSFVDREGQFTLAFYQALPQLKRSSILFVPPLTAVRNSIGYALLTVLAAGFLGLLSAQFLARPSRWRGLLDPLFMLPLGASAVALGFGYVISFDRLRTSPLLVLIAHTLIALPFVVRALLPVMCRIKSHRLSKKS